MSVGSNSVTVGGARPSGGGGFHARRTMNDHNNDEVHRTPAGRPQLTAWRSEKNNKTSSWQNSNILELEDENIFRRTGAENWPESTNVNNQLPMKDKYKIQHQTRDGNRYSAGSDIQPCLSLEKVLLVTQRFLKVCFIHFSKLTRPQGTNLEFHSRLPWYTRVAAWQAQQKWQWWLETPLCKFSLGQIYETNQLFRNKKTNDELSCVHVK